MKIEGLNIFDLFGFFTNPTGKSLTGSSKRHNNRKEVNMDTNIRVYGRGVHIAQILAKKGHAPAMGKQKQKVQTSELN